MNPEAIKHRDAVRIARAKYFNGETSEGELNAVVDAYIAFMVQRVGKSKAKRFTRSYILRAL